MAMPLCHRFDELEGLRRAEVINALAELQSAA
jgi:hypothetical protein